MGRARIALYVVAALVIAFAVWQLFSISQATDKAERLQESLAEQVRQGQEAVEGEVSPSSVEVLRQANPHTVAWLTVEGTQVDYPVMQTPEDPEYYLTHDFEGEESEHGALFLDADCELGGTGNLVIYGHHMNDGTMFASLMQFRDAVFCEANPEVRLVTADKALAFRPVVVMVLSEAEFEQFPYYRCLSLTSEDTYNGFLARCRNYAVWQAAEMPRLGTRLLMLSTCEYTKANGRLVVLCQQVANAEAITS